MERPSIWVIIVVLLLGVLFPSEPRFQRSEETFLRWLIQHSQPAVKAVPITIVDTGRENPPSPLETALLLQARSNSNRRSLRSNLFCNGVSAAKIKSRFLSIRRCGFRSWS